VTEAETHNCDPKLHCNETHNCDPKLHGTETHNCDPKLHCNEINVSFRDSALTIPQKNLKQGRFNMNNNREIRK
jgi:hypothetical protein